MRITIVTLFPELVDAVVGQGVLGRALQAGVATVRALQLRDFATDKHRSVDDSPAGGGAGMVLKVDVVAPAGIVTAMRVSPRTSNGVMSPPRRTSVAPVKPLPSSSTRVPGGPAPGRKAPSETKRETDKLTLPVAVEP